MRNANKNAPFFKGALRKTIFGTQSSTETTHCRLYS